MSYWAICTIETTNEISSKLKLIIFFKKLNIGLTEIFLHAKP
jgi:hypothetical protein